jgi:hypothetical protein
MHRPAGGGLERSLDAIESVGQAAPARDDQVDEQAEIVDAGVALGLKVGLQPLEPANRLVGQAAHLGELPCDGLRFCPESFAHRVRDVPGQLTSQLRGALCQRLELAASPLEDGVDVGREWAPGGSLCETLASPLDRVLVHNSTIPCRPDEVT